MFSLALQAQERCTWIGSGKSVDPYHYTSVKSADYNNAAVSSAHPLASMVGAYIMQQGGNAFDAVIATQLALAVVYPGAGNIGGGGFLVGRTQDDQLIALDYRETAPAAATRNMYLDANGNAQTTLSQNGHLSSGVPGTVAGLFATMPYAKLPFQQLIQPAIDLATYGFCITANEAKSLNNLQDAFMQYNTTTPVFVKTIAWKAGDTLIQPALAATLKRIQQQGRKGFYEGETAQFIVKEMQHGKGIITLDDLKNYTAKKREPVLFNYKGYDVVAFPPPSSGGIILQQVLKMSSFYPIDTYGFHSPQSVQVMIEAERRAYADRAEHLGDPDYWKVPEMQLTATRYLQDKMKSFTPGKASQSTDIHAGNFPESKETTHISVIDKAGNMVSVTTTLNGSYGSKTVVSGAGFLLNNEMDDFSIKPGVPNMYGAVGGDANAIVPGKRMLSSMCPVVVLKDQHPFIVAGTPGGTTIPTSVFQTLVNMIDYKMLPANAVNKPKFHHQWLPDEVYVEKGFPDAVREQLIQMGYVIKEVPQIGRTEVIGVYNGIFKAAADIRGDDAVAGF